VTAKERLLERAPDWTEEQAVRALRAVEGDSRVDEWGDLAAVHDISCCRQISSASPTFRDVYRSGL